MIPIERLLALYDDGMISDGELLSRAVALPTSVDDAVAMMNKLPPKLRQQLVAYAQHIAAEPTVVGFDSGAGAHDLDKTFRGAVSAVVEAAARSQRRSLRAARTGVYSHSLFSNAHV
jgi:hypothetical protein